VNQHGVVQPIGGVNEKIEGFFDVCRTRGLTGDQGAFPDDTINGRVEARLREFADRRRQFALSDGQAESADG
jgi:hypothetical protein